MEDVFDMSGKPPEGWMHALFRGGPYAKDVGRCVPGPPAPVTLAVPLVEGGVHVYRLWTVGSWSDPDDPIAVYIPDGPPVPPPVLSAQEEEWLRKGPVSVGLVALTDDGRIVREPDASAVEGMIGGLGERQYLRLQRVGERGGGDCSLLVLLAEDGTYEVERETGAGGVRRRTRFGCLAEVCGVAVRWAFGEGE